jgi:hypothetical protein
MKVEVFYSSGRSQNVRARSRRTAGRVDECHMEAEALVIQLLDALDLHALPVLH